MSTAHLLQAGASAIVIAVGTSLPPNLLNVSQTSLPDTHSPGNQLESIRPFDERPDVITADHLTHSGLLARIRSTSPDNKIREMAEGLKVMPRDPFKQVLSQMRLAAEILYYYPVMPLTEFFELAATNKRFLAHLTDLSRTPWETSPDDVDDLLRARRLLIVAIHLTNVGEKATSECSDVWNLLRKNDQEINSNEKWSLVFLVWAKLTFESEVIDTRGLSRWADRVRSLPVDITSLRFEETSKDFDISRLHQFLEVIQVFNMDILCEINELEQSDNNVYTIKKIFESLALVLPYLGDPLIPEILELELLIIRSWPAKSRNNRRRVRRELSLNDESFLRERLITWSFKWLSFLQGSRSSHILRVRLHSREAVILGKLSQYRDQMSIVDLSKYDGYYAEHLSYKSVSLVDRN